MHFCWTMIYMWIEFSALWKTGPDLPLPECYFSYTSSPPLYLSLKRNRTSLFARKDVQVITNNGFKRWNSCLSSFTKNLLLHLVSFREEHERIGDIIKKYSHFLKVTLIMIIDVNIVINSYWCTNKYFNVKMAEKCMSVL